MKGRGNHIYIYSDFLYFPFAVFKGQPGVLLNFSVQLNGLKAEWTYLVVMLSHITVPLS